MLSFTVIYAWNGRPANTLKTRPVQESVIYFDVNCPVQLIGKDPRTVLTELTVFQIIINE